MTPCGVWGGLQETTTELLLKGLAPTFIAFSPRGAKMLKEICRTVTVRHFPLHGNTISLIVLCHEKLVRKFYMDFWHFFQVLGIVPILTEISL